jgi:hypothetical protein
VGAWFSTDSRIWHCDGIVVVVAVAAAAKVVVVVDMDVAAGVEQLADEGGSTATAGSAPDVAGYGEEGLADMMRAVASAADADAVAEEEEQ